MTLLTAIVSGVIVASLALVEVEKYVNIFEALFAGIEKSSVVKNTTEKTGNWKRAYV